MTQAAHHPLIAHFEPAEDDIPEGCMIDYFGFVGVPIIDRAGDRTPVEGDPTPFNNVGTYQPRDLLSATRRHQASNKPRFDEEYLESIDLLEAIANSGNTFVMFELGAGYGRWGIRAYQFVRRHYPGKKAHIVFAEAEPVHYEDLQYHLKLNAIPRSDVTLYEAAVSDMEKTIPFYIRCNGYDHPHQWYGQAIQHNPMDLRSGEFTVGAYNGRPMYINRQSGHAFINVKCQRFSKMAQGFSLIDLVDMDIQGDEAKVVAESMEELNRRVKRLHIGTHGHDIEEDLRKLLNAQGWNCIHDYPCQGPSDTPYGKLEFIDGVQSWLNPRLNQPRP